MHSEDKADFDMAALVLRIEVCSFQQTIFFPDKADMHDGVSHPFK
jgi:hypothetical protein